MGGFVASAYMRGVPYVNVPTTLIGQVDAGIGGKLAVNHPVAKNLIGGFFQPRAVISDVSFLRTIGRRQLRAGLAEAIKKAIIASPAYWDLIEAQRGGDPRRRSARRSRSSCTARGDQGRADRTRPVRGGLAPDARLRARDRTPVETVTAYSEVLHGEAVAFGMASSASSPRPAAAARRAARAHPRAAAARGAADDGGRAAGRRGRDRLLGATERIRLIRGGGYRFVLPIDIGETLIADDVAPRS